MTVDENKKEMYKIGEFAKIINVSISSLQRWDKNGLLKAIHGKGNRRYYTKDHIKKYDQLKKENKSRLSRRKNPKYKDLTGNVYGKLTVLNRADDWIGLNGHRHIQWNCICECGNKTVIKGSSLQSGYNKSCGCSQYGNSVVKKMWDDYKKLEPEKILENVKKSSFSEPLYVNKKRNKHSKRNNKFHDLTGLHFGFWTVIERSEDRFYKNGGRVTTWLCKCKCGNFKVVPARDLKRGASKSCGCLKSMSWLEYYVKEFLFDHNYDYYYQKKYPDLIGTGGKSLSYDFLILKNNQPYCLIECQGEQHFKPVKKFGGSKKYLKQQVHDLLKRKYAKDILNIPLYEISYKIKTKEGIYEILNEII